MRRLQLRPTPERVSWFELFYDLIVIAAVGHGSEVFGKSPTWGTGLVIGVSVIVLFVVWLLTTLNHGVFPGDHPARGALVLVQMLALTVAALSIGEEGLPTDVGFVALGVALAAIFVLWVLTRHARPDGPALARPVIAGSALGALLMIAAGIQPDDSLAVRALAAVGVIAAGAPVVTTFLARATRDGAIDAEHLEERLGLFILIMLGESFAHLVGDLAEKPSIPNPVFFALTFVVVFATWILYRASTASTRLPVTANGLRLWLGAHLVLAFGAISVATSFADLSLTPMTSLGAGDTGHGPWTALPLAYVVTAMLMLAAIARLPRSVLVAHAIALVALLVLVLLDLLGAFTQTSLLVLVGAVVVVIDAVVVSRIQAVAARVPTA